MRKASLDEKREIEVAEDIFLDYLNTYLHKYAIISDKEFGRMSELLATRKRKAKLSKSS